MVSGKFYMINHIVSMMPRHVCYVEPFGGAASILFGKEKSKVEVYNDLNDWLVNLYSVIRNQPQELLDRLEMTPYSRSLYGESVIKYKASQRGKIEIDPIEKAVLFFVLIKQSFNSVPGGTFAYASVASKGSAWCNAKELIMPAHQRLKEVLIECLNYEDIFEKYDGLDTLFYLDPPYVHITRDSGTLSAYEFEMSDTDHTNLCWNCSELEGMVIMSAYHSDIYDSILVKELGWGYKEVDVICSSSYVPESPGKPKRREVLYWNQAVEQNTSQMVLTL